MILLKITWVIFCIKEYVLWKILTRKYLLHIWLCPEFRSFYWHSNEPEKLKLILSQVEVPVFSYSYFTHNELFHIKSLRVSFSGGTACPTTLVKQKPNSGIKKFLVSKDEEIFFTYLVV